MGRAEDTLMCMGIIYLILLFLAVSTALFASTAAQSYPLYEVKPLFCDNGIYSAKNETWKISEPWHLMATQGACPSSKRERFAANWWYKSCLDFKDKKDEWQNLDRDNGKAGYSSNFRGDVTRWENSGRLSQAATFFLWFSFIVWPFCYCYRKEWYAEKLIWVPYVSMIICCFLWIGALDTVLDTTMLDIDAWSKVFFKSCTVIIPRGSAYILGTYVIVTTGVFLFLFFTMFVYYCNRDFIVYHLFDPDSEAKQARYYIIGEAFKERDHSLLDFHAALVDHIYFSLSIFWKRSSQSGDDVITDIEEGEVPEGTPIKLSVLNAETGKQRCDISVLDTAKVSELNELVRVVLNKGRGKVDANKKIPKPLYKAKQLHFEYNKQQLVDGVRLYTYGIRSGENITLSLDPFTEEQEKAPEESFNLLAFLSGATPEIDVAGMVKDYVKDQVEAELEADYDFEVPSNSSDNEPDTGGDALLDSDEEGGDDDGDDENDDDGDEEEKEKKKTTKKTKSVAAAGGGEGKKKGKGKAKKEDAARKPSST